MHFIKMQALGNDYVYVDCFQEEVPDAPGLARRISERHTGVGSDGLILICPSDIAVCRMRMFNPDGSEARMCGNGLRCVAKYVYEAGYAKEAEFDVETGAGVRHQRVKVQGGVVEEVTSWLGRPILERKDIPMLGEGSTVEIPLEIPELSQTWPVTCLSVGNPHAVLFVGQLEAFPCEKLGPLVENHEWFPERTNVEFAEVLGKDRVRLKVWERGAGMTLSCGSGATATAVAGVLTGKTGRKVVVEQQLGKLEIEYREDKELLMSGPAVKVFEGEW